MTDNPHTTLNIGGIRVICLPSMPPNMIAVITQMPKFHVRMVMKDGQLVATAHAMSPMEFALFHFSENSK